MGCRVKVNCPHVRPGPIVGVPSVGRGEFLSDHSPYLREFWRKPQKTQNGCPGIESGASLLPAIKAEPLGHWWGSTFVEKTSKLILHIGIYKQK